MNYNFENLNIKMIAFLFAIIVICTVISFTGIFPPIAENFSYSAIQVAPFMLLAFTAYLSDKYPGLKIFTTIWLLVVILIVAMTSFAIGMVSILPEEFFSGVFETGGSNFSLLNGGAEYFDVFQIVWLFLAVIVASALSLAGQIRKFRIFLSRYIPIDPDSFIHKTALTAVFAMTLIPFVSLLITQTPPLLSPVFLEVMNSTGMTADMLSLDVFSLFWMILASFVMAGLYINRSFPDVLKRLGLVKPSKKELLYAIGAGIALVGVFFAIEYAINAVWEFLGWATTDSDSVNLLFAAFLTPFAAVIAAISAGFGEEIAIRGLLQPRFGIIIPSVLFAALHAFQYNWDGVLSVFIAGIVFAILRKHYNTTFSAVTHTVYDLILFYMIMLGIGI